MQPTHKQLTEALIKAVEALSHDDFADCRCTPDNAYLDLYTYTKHPKCGFCKASEALNQIDPIYKELTQAKQKD